MFHPKCGYFRPRSDIGFQKTAFSNIFYWKSYIEALCLCAASLWNMSRWTTIDTLVASQWTTFVKNNFHEFLQMLKIWKLQQNQEDFARLYIPPNRPVASELQTCLFCITVSYLFTLPGWCIYFPSHNQKDSNFQELSGQKSLLSPIQILTTSLSHTTDDTMLVSNHSRNFPHNLKYTLRRVSSSCCCSQWR